MARQFFAADIPGLPDLLKKIHTAGNPKIVNKALRKGLRAGTKVMAKDAKANAPVHQGAYPPGRKDRKPGTLKAAIKVRAMKRSRKGPGYRMTDFTGPNYYGAFQEYGTKKQKARPYLRPAFDRNVDIAVGMVRTAIKDAVEGAFKK